MRLIAPPIPQDRPFPVLFRTGKQINHPAYSQHDDTDRYGDIPFDRNFFLGGDVGGHRRSLAKYRLSVHYYAAVVEGRPVALERGRCPGDTSGYRIVNDERRWMVD